MKWAQWGCSFAIFLCVSSTEAAVSQTMCRRTVQEPVCVNGQCQVRMIQQTQFGTAFTIGRRAGRDVWLTCGHNFPPGATPYVAYGGQWVPMVLKGRTVSDGKDLAVLEAKTDAQGHYRLGVGRMGDPVRMVGYPRGASQAVVYRTALARRSIQDTPYLELGSKPGLSGCPVVADSGECVGVVWGDDPGRGAVMTGGTAVREFVESIYGTAELIPPRSVPRAPGDEDDGPNDPLPIDDRSEFERIAGIAKRNKLKIELMERSGRGAVDELGKRVDALQAKVDAVDPNGEWEAVDLGPLEQATEANKAAILELKQKTDRILALMEEMESPSVDLSGIEQRLAALENRKRRVVTAVPVMVDGKRKLKVLDSAEYEINEPIILDVEQLLKGGSDE